MASCRVPILLAVSPLAATLSAPTATASTFPADVHEEGREEESEHKPRVYLIIIWAKSISYLFFKSI